MPIEPDFFDTVSTVGGVDTPPETLAADVLAEDYMFSLPKSVETAPCPGQTYMIRDPTSQRLITLSRGRLCLEDHAGDRGGYHWECVETKGWLGFRNPAFNVYIGHDGHDAIVAEKSNHKGWEYFCVRRHPDGGYLLLSRWWDDLWKVDIARDGHSLIRKDHGGVAWEFVKV
ncbi:hypothetical protein F4677DRAFT_443032 [Hypoxylon crocopeplum]|nr:hypothetical protein F4677DRAFT_443032 [Hypoxylon crocopeplum]